MPRATREGTVRWRIGSSFRTDVTAPIRTRNGTDSKPTRKEREGIEWRTGVLARPARAGRPCSMTTTYTPTGNGLVWVSALRDKPEKRPCNKDINPVYQYPSTNKTRKGTVM